MTFGERITNIRIAKGLTIRKVSLKLQTLSSSSYSKIERGIQNPVNKDQFNEIIDALEITEPEIISELEQLAMQFIPPKEMTDEELVKHLPVFLPPNFDIDKLDDLKRIIRESELPDPPSKD